MIRMIHFLEDETMPVIYRDVKMDNFQNFNSSDKQDDFLLHNR